MDLEKIPNLTSEGQVPFEEGQKQIWEWQLKNCAILRQYVESLGGLGQMLMERDGFVPLPISSFKSQTVKTGAWKAECVFESSRTTGQVSSRRHVKSLRLYNYLCVSAYEKANGSLTQQNIIGLLPGYLERENASLVAMVRAFMAKNETGQHILASKAENSVIEALQKAEQNTVVIGVTHALLDLTLNGRFPDCKAKIFITGGMKGLKREMIAQEVLEQMQAAFPKAEIGFEFGMTELFSQAYAKSDGIYKCPPWLKISTRSLYDPFEPCAEGEQGRLCLMDLGNVHTCSFILSDDIGRVYEDGSFELLGRLDHAELRGCNLMQAQ